jgi:hypothetical protein
MAHVKGTGLGLLKVLFAYVQARFESCPEQPQNFNSRKGAKKNREIFALSVFARFLVLLFVTYFKRKVITAGMAFIIYSLQHSYVFSFYIRSIKFNSRLSRRIGLYIGLPV